MKKPLIAVTTVAALATPVANAFAALTPKKVVTKSVTVHGTEGSAGQWGFVKVTLVIKKTTTTVGKKTTVARRITKVTVPEFPNHTSRSIFINQQALPMLVQEEMSAQFDLNKVDVISGATATSYAFGDSMQAALLAAKKV